MTLAAQLQPHEKQESPLRVWQVGAVLQEVVYALPRQTQDAAESDFLAVAAGELGADRGDEFVPQWRIGAGPQGCAALRSPFATLLLQGGSD